MGASRRRVWIDLENSPHVPFFLPWIEWLRADGHEVHLTARDLSQTHELLRLHRLEFDEIGGHGMGGALGKGLRVLGRATRLARWAAGRRFHLAMGHGSRAQAVAAAMLRLPALSFIDYEFVSLRAFALCCTQVFVPDAVPAAVLAGRGLPARKLTSYRGFKEQLYLDPDAADSWQPADPPLVLVRPPARRAHYHSEESERRYGLLVERLVRQAGHCRVRFLPRYEDDRATLAPLARAHAHVEIADSAVDGIELVRSAALVASGGGTMVREAAVLGVPSVSFFGGPLGGVDRELARAGRLVLLREDEDVARVELPPPGPVDAWRSRWSARLADAGRLEPSARVRERLREAVAPYLR